MKMDQSSFLILFLRLFIGCNFLILCRTQLHNYPHQGAPMRAEIDYLYKHGYLSQEEKEYSLQSHDSTLVEGAVRNMQRFYHIRPSGTVDEETRRLIHAPRCGLPDVGFLPHDPGRQESRRMRRYSILGEQYVWDKSKPITYSIINYPRHRNFKNWEVHKIMKNAFRVWSSVTPLDFEEIKGESKDNATIRIAFERGRHSYDEDHPKFDGPGGDLAHAFAPKAGWGKVDGDIHFDGDENFILGSGSEGYNLYQIAVHEIGHALGLRHSTKPNSIMYPTYRYLPDFRDRLPYDDELGIQKLYGVRMRESKLKGVLSKSYCSLHYPTVFSIGRQMYALRGSRYWESNGWTLTSSDGGLLINKQWYDLPSNIRAAYYRFDGATLFFKGGKYWLYNGSFRVVGYPQKVSNLGLPNHIEAVLTFGEKTYFFKKSKVWKYDERKRQVEKGFPKKITEIFHGLPERITAGFHYNDGNSYIFDGKEYYRMNDRTRSVDRGYPRYFTIDFLGCRSI